MKCLCFIQVLFVCCSCFGQDHLHADSLPAAESAMTVDTMPSNSLSSIHHIPAKKKLRKKIQVVTPPSSPAAHTLPVVDTNNQGFPWQYLFYGIIAAGVIIAAVPYLNALRSGYRGNYGNTEPISDYLDNSRKLLSRKDFYRNVYLKSDEWQRKRFVVLKRDGWTCVYCGNKATQVHHKRYAKRNIGKEPIEWLVSVCARCHEEVHSKQKGASS